MMHSSGPRKTVSLSKSIQRQLNMYTLAASAAGVSALVLSQPAEAKIVYTPAHIKIGFGGVDLYNLNLNHDGTVDFTIDTGSSCANTCNFYLGAFGPAYSNAVEMAGVRDAAAALHPGARIGPAKQFDIGFMNMATVYYSTYGKRSVNGQWVNVANRYLGLKFLIKGKIHYGWARLSVKVQGHAITATLTGYAYETIPNKAIIAGQTKGPDDTSIEESDAALTLPAPEPPTLGALALGAPGLSIWRREESVGAAR